MMTILLLYLMISPCGAYLSVDRAIRRWWSQAKPGVLQAWFRFWNKPVPDAADIAPAPFSEIPAPSICANVAIRCLQIHVCIIYTASGLSKLLGPAWWNGTAIWGTIANYEFAVDAIRTCCISLLAFPGQQPVPLRRIHDLRRAVHAHLRDRLRVPDLAAQAALVLPRRCDHSCTPASACSWA